MSRPKQPERREWWRQRIIQQEKSGQGVRAFCIENSLKEHSFYMWRRQLSSAREKPIRFALVETTKHQAITAPIELILNTGERLQIPADASTLRLVLSVLQKHT